jgi:hypothetical protein
MLILTTDLTSDAISVQIRRTDCEVAGAAHDYQDGISSELELSVLLVFVSSIFKLMDKYDLEFS